MLKCSLALIPSRPSSGKLLFKWSPTHYKTLKIFVIILVLLMESEAGTFMFSSLLKTNSLQVVTTGWLNTTEPLQAYYFAFYIIHNSGLHECIHNSSGIETAEVIIGLTCTHKHNGLTCDVGHRNCSTNLKQNKKKTLAMKIILNFSTTLNSAIKCTIWDIYIYFKGKKSPTLSSIVSNLVSTMPSMSLGWSDMEWSASAWLNLTCINTF